MAASCPAKLPVWRTLRQAHHDVIGAGRDFARFAAVWLLVLLVLDAAINWTYWPIQKQTAGQLVLADWLYAAASSLLWIAIGGIVGVRLHRRLMADRLSPPGTAPMQVERSTLVRYVRRNVAIVAIAIVPAFLFIYVVSSLIGLAVAAPPADSPLPAPGAGSLSELSWEETGVAMRMAFGLAAILPLVLLFALPLYIPTRFSLALPATAIDSARQTFADTWVLSRGSFWRLYGGGVLSYWPAFAETIAAVALANIENETRVEYLLSAAATTATSYLAGLIWVAFFSRAYLHLMPPDLDSIQTLSDART